MTEVFAADWLALRAPADDRARDPGLVAALADWARGRPIRINDIGGGDGATRRAIGGTLPGARWLVVDADPALLLHAAAAGAEISLVDLAARPEAAFAGGPNLMTASAFFDLVSEDWIAAFAEGLATRRLPLYAALTYDGRENWRPTPPHEAAAREAFRADMRRDKGFGPALGAAAHAMLAAALRARGYEVREAESDWRLERGRDDALIAALAEGGAEAPMVRAALSRSALAEWRAGRGAAETVLIGHRDLLALPR